MCAACELEGLPAAAESLATLHSRELVAIAQSEGLDGEEAFDTVQDAFCTFLKLPTSGAHERQQGDARARLAAIVRNVARNKRRRHYRQRVHEAIDSEAPSGSDNPEELLHQAEQSSQLARCIGNLDDIRRAIVRLRMLEELSGADAARILGITPGNVAVLLHRAKEDLRICMQADGNEELNVRANQPTTR